MVWLILSIVSLLLLYSLLQGAPYVPTKRRDAKMVFELLALSKGSLFVDVGCGDGIMLKRAAERGYKAIGIEINPILWLIASWRCRKYKAVRVLFGNVWSWHLPKETRGVFVFGAGPFMQRLTRWFEAEQARLKSPLKIVSLGFPLERHRASEERGALFLYTLHLYNKSVYGYY